MSPVLAPSAPAPTAPIRAASRSWALRRTGALLLPAGAAVVLLLTLATIWPQARPGLLGMLGALLLLLAGVLGRTWQQPAAATARRLNRQHPVLEDSAALLLAPPESLNLLAQLQQQRLLHRLPELTAAGPLLPVDGRWPMAATVLLLALAGLAWWQRPASAGQPTTTTLATAPVPMQFRGPTGQPVAAPRIVATRLRVQPPAYTRQTGFAPTSPSFRCPQASRVRWTVQVNRPAAAAPVLELGTRRLPLRPVPGQPTEFVLEQVITTTTLYRLRFAGQVSDDYSIEVQPDQAPTIRLISPKAYTLVEFGRPPQVVINAQLRDDYGLTRARLVATVAQGQGEAVKFREVITDLSSTLRGQPTAATLRPVLRLPALGLTYGDEVYFYLQAWDNHQQMSRSDTYLVQWEDTTVQESTLDASLGVSTAPAYFRSQRQIIIDTEKLLAQQRQLPAADLLERSNTIGFDQKVLRMRYGKFLGEEADETIGGATRPTEADAPAAEPGLGSVVAEDHTEPEPAEQHSPDDGHDHSAPPAPNATSHEARTAELMEPYMHRHDDSETADFLEPTVKAKLRAVLSEMWESELRLRTGRPREALPYEYRALRLLKQVQQQTRAYVKKAGFTPPPMPEATTRLTGDLAGAAAPRRQQQLSAPPQQPAVRAALRVLEQLRARSQPAAGGVATLELAGQELARAALQKPGAYLSALRELRLLTGNLRAGRAFTPSRLPLVERALTDLLPSAPPLPATRSTTTLPLTRRYFQELDTGL